MSLTDFVAEVIETADWHRDAACRDADPNLFFPGVGEKPDKARALCRVCPEPTWQTCFDFGLNEVYGVWAGTTNDDRVDLRAGRRTRTDIAYALRRNRQMSG